MNDPIVYTLRNDNHAARFGLAPWERDYLLTRCFLNRVQGNVRGRIEVLVGHIQAGITTGSLDWWVNGRDKYGNPIQASSNIMTQQDGSILEVIDAKHGPWTNGDVLNPTAASAELRSRGANPNIWSWTCEAEGQPWTNFTPEHWHAICTAFDRQLAANPHLDPARDVIAHGSINSVDRSQCGLYVPRLIAELIGDHRPKDTIGTVTKYATAIPVLVTAAAGLNIRKWGELDQPITGYMPPGTVFPASGHVLGDSVDGENRWYIHASNAGRSWVGGTNKPNLV